MGHDRRWYRPSSGREKWIMTAISTPKPPIDFTVIGGFLGAGKTTFVNQVLGATSGTRFAVLVNDFGALNIDESLITHQTGKIMKLANGCICCSLAGGLVDAMLALMEYRDELDHILIEASGVSYPSRIMDFARIDRDLRPGLTIVLIDAVQFTAQLNDAKLAETIQAQIEGADLFLISKGDIAGQEAVAATRAALQARYANVPMVERHPDDDLARFLVFGAGTGLDISNGQAVESGIGDEHDTFEVATHHHNDRPHAGFGSFALQANDMIDLAAFRALVTTHCAPILRGKGILRSVDGVFVWQQTGRLITLDPANDLQLTAPSHSRIIVISPDDLSEVQAAFVSLGFVPVPGGGA